MKVNINAGVIKNVINADKVNLYEQYLEKFIKEKVPIKDKLKVFISYSHKDSDIKEKLDIHLASLKRNEQIATWSDTEIMGGEEWDEKIKTELNEADLILLLITANFIASDYIWKFELSKAIERHNSGLSIVIPVFSKPCEFSDMPFSKLQGLPRDAVPLSESLNIDLALKEVVSGIKFVIDSRTNKKYKSTQL